MLLLDALKRRLLAPLRTGPPAHEAPALQRFIDDVEAVLQDIDFVEVTFEDKITFVQLAADWQARRARERGRLDLEAQLRRFRDDRVAELREEHARVLRWNRCRIENAGRLHASRHGRPKRLEG
jgi:hypothetical protein